MDSHRLVKDCLRGNAIAQRELYELYSESMLGICYRYTKSMVDAEDVLQEGFIKVYMNLHQYKFEGELGGWIRRIMVNTAINYLKKNARYQVDLSFLDNGLHPVSDDDPGTLMNAKELADLIRQLPTGYQTIFNLHGVEGFSHVEIGKILGINEGTSRSQYSRARALLISWLKVHKNADLKKRTMPGHEFEKNVQQRLDELKLRPSDTVWKNVEKNIREEKRRRRAILWLPILLLFLGTSGYFLISKNGFVSGETVVTTKPTKEKNNSSTSSITKEENKTANLQNEEKEKDKNQELSPKDLNEKSAAKIPKNRNTTSNTRQSQLSTIKYFDKNTIAVSKNKDQVQSLTKGQENVDLTRNQNDVQLKENDEDLIEYANINPTLIKGSGPAVGISIPENHSATIQTPEVDLNALSASNKNEKYRSAKWQWGLDLSLGTSSASSELNLLKSTAQMDNGSLGVNVGSNFQTSAGRPSSISIEPGFYWAAGGFIQRNFSNSFAVSTGLRYAQYSTRIFTETRVDSSRIFINSRNSTTADQASQYSNRYHFLELPVTAQFKLNKSNSFPVFANLGMSVGWLLGANAVNFEGNSGANLFNETQFGLHGGFSFGVLNKSKYPLRVGPSFNYKLSQLMDNASSSKHLLSFGVDFRVLLKK